MRTRIASSGDAKCEVPAFFTNVGGIANGGRWIAGGNSGPIAGSANVALALD
ncbi:MAG: hypothetical protein ACO1PZ_09150 [Gammaproteobacteria bacterium]